MARFNKSRGKWRAKFPKISRNLHKKRAQSCARANTKPSSKRRRKKSEKVGSAVLTNVKCLDVTLACILFAFFSFVAVLWIVAGDEVVEVAAL